jgi:hypothetical protein
MTQIQFVLSVFFLMDYLHLQGVSKNVSLLETRIKARNCISKPGPRNPYRDILLEHGPLVLVHTRSEPGALCQVKNVQITGVDRVVGPEYRPAIQLITYMIVQLRPIMDYIDTGIHYWQHGVE